MEHTATYDTRKAMKDIAQGRSTRDGHAHAAAVMQRQADRLRAAGDTDAADQYDAIAAQHRAAAKRATA